MDWLRIAEPNVYKRGKLIQMKKIKNKIKEQPVWIFISITLSEDDADEVCGVLSCRKQKVPVQIKLKRRIL